jgi:Protein of unknown function (DUF3102)
MNELPDYALLPYSAAPPPSEGASFDYSTLDPDLAEEARATAARVKGRLRTSAVDIGNDLISIKEKLSHGRFGSWLELEFSWSVRHAEGCMNAARLAAKYEITAHLPHTILVALAAPSADPDVVEGVLKI